uniref:Uncharacterized protein n=1 Tax=Arundo donax TaxID=35708 RepID=A0A0A9EXV2_ARUDO
MGSTTVFLISPMLHTLRYPFLLYPVLILSAISKLVVALPF